MTDMPPKVGTVHEELWLHKSDGSRVRASLAWLRNYLANNPGLLLELGYMPRGKVVNNCAPVPVYHPPASATKPIPPGKSPAPAWSTAPANPEAGKPAAVVAAPLLPHVFKKVPKR